MLAPGEENLKSPAWLNDVTMYHNRGNTTFTGEDSQYGDFFGLDDLFTERPEVVDGMVDIYETWVEDFDIDGFRIDTMKHVNDEFWQQFGPSMQAIAAADGNPDFFMFGEVALDGSDAAAKSFTSHYTTHDRMQAILDFPFQDAARGFASKGLDNQRLAQFFANDDWYTDRDSNVYELPTFLGNHDMGRIGFFLKADNPGAADAELLARDRLAHELMYFSRGNPVVYYGDEQGFTGSGGDQVARQTMFASQVPEYLGDDLIGTDRTHAQDNFVTDSPLYLAIQRARRVTGDRPALRDGAEQVRYASSGPGVFAFSRIDRKHQKEYVVALNNSESAASADVPTFIRKGRFNKVYGAGPAAPDHAQRPHPPREPAGAVDGGLRVGRPHPALALSAAHQSRRARAGGGVARPDARRCGRAGRLVLRGDLPAEGRPRELEDHRRRRLRAVPGLRRRLVSRSRSRSPTARPCWTTTAIRVGRPPGATVPGTTVTIEAPADGAHGARHRRGARGCRPGAADRTWSSSSAVWPAARGRHRDGQLRRRRTPCSTTSTRCARSGTRCVPRHSQRARWHQVTSAVRSVRHAGPPATMARLHYFRPAGDYTDWGLHMWADAVDPAVLAQIAWDHPWPLTRISGGWADTTSRWSTTPSR